MLKGTVDFPHYLINHFKPMDILGTTDYNPLARLIWKETWFKGKWWWWLVPYVKRMHLCTHIAVMVLGKDKYKWVMEMDVSKLRNRYIKDADGSILSPMEYIALSKGDRCGYRLLRVNSGLILSPIEKYMPVNKKDRHITWIGSPYGLGTDEKRFEANEKMFELYRKGVEYDYLDLLSFTSLTKKLKIGGTDDAFICSELPQRVFEQMGILPPAVAPMSPMQWQNDRRFTYNVRIAERN